MNYLPSQTSALTIAGVVFGALMLVPFLIGSLLMLIPILLVRGFARVSKSLAAGPAFPADVMPR